MEVIWQASDSPLSKELHGFKVLLPSPPLSLFLRASFNLCSPLRTNVFTPISLPIALIFALSLTLSLTVNAPSSFGPSLVLPLSLFLSVTPDLSLSLIPVVDVIKLFWRESRFPKINKIEK